MTPSKKTAQPKPDITTPAQPSGTQLEPLPAAAGAEAQTPADASVERQDVAPQTAGAEVGADVADALDAAQPIKEPRYRITARHPQGFWRCGRKWHPDGELLTLSEIGGEAVLAALQAEPMLIVAVEP